MIKNVCINELLFSDLFVREPVDEVNDKITDSKKKKIILVGNRGCGKSVVLGSREIKSVNTEHPAILMKFDGAGIFGKENSKSFDNSFIEHYYEVVMCRKFLNYIKTYYPKLFHTSFINWNKIISGQLVSIDRYINDMFDGNDIQHKFSSGEMFNEVLALFREGSKAKSVTLMLDRFDWIHNSDSRVQKILKNYFDIFDKVILTSDDPTLSEDEERISSLRKDGYSFIQVGYSSDLNTVVDIVERRFELDEDSDTNYVIDEVFDEDYLKLIDICDGNIDMLLNIFQYVDTLRKWDKNKELSSIIDEASTEKKSENNQYKKMITQPKFYVEN